MSNFWKKNDGLNVKNDKHDICPLCKLQTFPSCYKNDFIKFKYGINYKTTYAKNHALEILPNNKIISIGGYKSKKVLIQTENIITKKCPDIYIERCNFYSCIHYDGTIIIWGGWDNKLNWLDNCEISPPFLWSIKSHNRQPKVLTVIIRELLLIYHRNNKENNIMYLPKELIFKIAICLSWYDYI